MSEQTPSMVTDPGAWQRAMRKAGLSQSVIEYVTTEAEGDDQTDD